MSVIVFKREAEAVHECYTYEEAGDYILSKTSQVKVALDITEDTPPEDVVFVCNSDFYFKDEAQGTFTSDEVISVTVLRLKQNR